MKKLLLAALLLTPTVNAANSDNLVRWKVGTGISIDISFIEFDVNVYRKYISFTGAIIDSQNGYLPATGSCFQLVTSGVFQGISCEFISANRRFEIDTDTNFTGTLKEKDSNGKILGSALITLVSVQ